MSAKTWSGVARGPLQPGEWVRLTDTKGRRHNICLTAGKQFFTNRGSIDHDALIGRPEGFSITSSAGTSGEGSGMAGRLVAGRPIGSVDDARQRDAFSRKARSTSAVDSTP